MRRSCTCRGLTLCPWCAALAARAGVLAPPEAPSPNEGVFLRAVLRVAREAGYLAYHTHDSRKSAAGFPDLVLVHPTRPRDTSPVWMVECKTATGQVTPAQAAWVEALDSRTTVAAIWRPEDMGLIRRWLRGED